MNQVLQYVNQAMIMLNVAFGAVAVATPADHPLPWWVPVLAAALNAVVHSLPAPSGSALPPAQVGPPKAMWLVSLIGASALYLAACANVTPAQTVTDACMSADTLLKSAMILDSNHKLTAQQVNAVSVAGATINGYCSQAAPPTDVQAALAGINGAAQSLATIPGVK